MKILSRKALTASALSLFIVSFALAQQSERDVYVEMYQKADFERSLSVARQAAKKNSSDWHAHYYAGLSYLKLDKEKDAVKSFDKAVSINPADASARTALAYAYMLRNDDRASGEANEALKLNKNNAEANYVLAVLAIRRQSYNVAYERAKAAIAIDPKSAPAYLVKAQALVSSFVKQRETVVRTESGRSSLLKEAVADLEKYLSMAANAKNFDFQKNSMESIRFFSEYYARNELKLTAELGDAQAPVPIDPNKEPLRLTSKPKASYTDRARQAGVQGSITLLVGFSADGTIKHIMLLKSLGYGLDEEAVRAARGIKFQPEMENGKPVPTVRPVTYTFNIY